MSREPHLSRRAALTGLAATCAAGLMSRASAEEAVPIFSSTGPNADRYGAAAGYPVPDAARARWQGNPWQPADRVGAFTHIDDIYPTRQVKRAAVPWAFKRAPVELSDPFRAEVTGYLARNPVTGLLIAKDDQILFEHYQYGRTDRHRFVSQSMVKSITGLLIGIAVSEGAIKSVDDTAEMYVRGFRGSEYGRTPIHDLLHMSSGIDFGEEAEGGRDLNRLWQDMVAGFSGKGTVNSIVQFNHRIAPPGTRFHYASIEPDVLGMVLRNATGKSLSDCLQEKIWQPIGTEADARWMVDAEGFELAHFGFNAVLRDYARLARLLAHDGAWGGRQIIPAQWVIDATTVRPSGGYLAPGKADRDFGYGYLLWLLPWGQRQFAMFGDFGQRVCIDPASKIVIVQTGLEQTPEIWKLWLAALKRFS
ncbi:MULTISPECIES: serine hydrolase domain-containing protein [unclassified Bradyrhizobium]|uniref:serine hydrolase domain-containing protein n=1 Tax=unclassified Bradyrhizobium TaxID=2631580 RepID=UPI002FEF057A